MTEGCDIAFRVVEIIAETQQSRTQGLDAFSLSLIRCEGQLRRLFTNLVFQASAFDRTHVDQLKAALAARSTIYFRHFKIGIEELSGVALSELVNDFDSLSERLAVATGYRNKLFHGQLTGSSLQTDELLSIARDIRLWCGRLSDGAEVRFGYDGFSGSSFCKRGIDDMTRSVDARIASVADYETLLGNLPALWKKSQEA